MSDSPMLPSLRIQYSKPCQAQKQMVTFCRDPHAQNKLAKYIFDRHTLQFLPATCLCQECLCIENLNNLEAGLQGMKFEESHRDEFRNPLVCIWIDWSNGNGYSGRMSVFARGDGVIGEFQWISNTGAFLLVKPLPVKVRASGRVSFTDRPLLDSQLTVVASYKCQSFSETIVLAQKPSFLKTPYKFLFNPLRHQFEEVFCNCDTCKTHGNLPPVYNGPLFSMKSKVTDGDIEIQKENGRFVKKMMEKDAVTSEWKMIGMEAAVVYQMSEGIERLTRRRSAEKAYVGCSERWKLGDKYLWPLFNGPDLLENVILLVDMQGNIAPYTKRVCETTGKMSPHIAEPFKVKTTVIDEKIDELLNNDDIFNVSDNEMEDSAESEESDEDYDEAPPTILKAPETVITGTDASGFGEDGFSVISNDN